MSGLQPSNSFLTHHPGLRPGLVYVGPLALNDDLGPLGLNDDLYRNANSALVSRVINSLHLYVGLSALGFVPHRTWGFAPGCYISGRWP